MGASPVRFGVFELDTQTGELRKHGVRLKIQDQPFQVLQALLERPGELVTREELKTRIWAHDSFVDFDQSLNRAINKVRDVLSDTAGAPRFIETLPRRGYRFIAHVEAAPRPGPVDTAPQLEPVPPILVTAPSYVKTGWMARVTSPLLKVAASVAGLALAGGAVWLIPRGNEPAPRISMLTTTPGIETTPSLSPDGRMVAFSWNGERRDNFDIYVKAIDSPTALRLTTDSSDEGFPSWSPDGRQIAFLRYASFNTIHLISPLGAPDRKLVDIHASYSRPAWSPNGDFLVVAKDYREPIPEAGGGALFLVHVRGAETRLLLAPKRGEWYTFPAISPNGRLLAFASCSGSTSKASCHITTVGLTEALEPVGKPRQLTATLGHVFGLDWTPDSRTLICGVNGYLWRLDTAAGKLPERLEIASANVHYPSVALKGNRLAFSRTHADEDIWRVEGVGKPQVFLASSLVDRSPQFSPDGRRIVFSSARGADRVAVWLAGANGANSAMLTGGSESHEGSPRWSPDGRWIAFDVEGSDGRFHIKIADTLGGQPRQLTSGSFNDNCPSWSADGRRVYFGSDRSGRYEIWRTHLEGGAPERITDQGGMVALESPDASTVYYTKSASEGPLFERRVDVGIEKKVLNSVVGRGFAVFDDGIYYLHRIAPLKSEIRFYRFAGGDRGVVSPIPFEFGLGLGVSPDRKTFLFTTIVPPENDLMLVDNFR